MIPFNVPAVTGNEEKYILEAIKNGKLSGDGIFTSKCHKWLEDYLGCPKILLTTSCTHALEMAALLINIKENDEVIMPSYTFVSTANAFALRGAKIVFVDIRKDTMNINEKIIEQAITSKTKAIVPVHYAGVSCDMDSILKIAKRYNLFVIEDAAQGVMSKYNNKALGCIGHIGCYSFHETKNYTCGEGGALVINDPELIARAEIIREKGTDRSRFFRGQVDKYTWVDIGSSYLPSELNAAYLFAQLEKSLEINAERLRHWDIYYKNLQPLAEKRAITLPFIPSECTHNAHMFFIKVKDLKERTMLIKYLKQHNIMSVFHYIPLHSSKAGKLIGKFYGTDKYTTSESEKLIRLPMFFKLKKEEILYICQCLHQFYK